jgi:hypothetical protein
MTQNLKEYLKNMENNIIDTAVIWWLNLPVYNMDKPCKRVLSNIYFGKEPKFLTKDDILFIWKAEQLKKR